MHRDRLNPLPDGVSYTQSHRYQQAANVPESDFETHVDDRVSSWLYGRMWWDRFIDFATVVWLVIFVAELVSSPPIPANTQWVLLSVFVADLGVKFRREPNKRTFLRRRWTDILMVIPIFRIFRILKFVRLLRILKSMRIAKAGRFPGVQMLETLRRKGSRIIRSVRR